MSELQTHLNLNLSVALVSMYADLATFFDVYVGGQSYSNMASGSCVTQGDSVACRDAMPRCYHRADTCVFDTITVDEKRQLDVQRTCRSGVHLRQDCG